jgi:hypothetical protein
MDLLDRYESIAFFMGIDPTKYAKTQRTIKNIADEARAKMLKT